MNTPPPLPMLVGVSLPPPLPIPKPAPTEWHPMSVAPARKGEYEVLQSKAGADTVRLEFFDGKRWPGLMGNFHVVGWRGLKAAQ